MFPQLAVTLLDMYSPHIAEEKVTAVYSNSRTSCH